MADSRAVALIAGATAAGIGALSLADALTATGLRIPVPQPHWACPSCGLSARSPPRPVGALLFATFLVPPQESGVLDAAATGRCDWPRWRRGVGGVRGTSGAMTISDVSGNPLREHLNPVGSGGSPPRWIPRRPGDGRRGLALVVTVVARSVLRWAWTPVLFALSLLTLVPLALTGHSAAGGSRLATNSLLIHLVAAALWSGGLLALLAHGMRRGEHTDLAAGGSPRLRCGASSQCSSRESSTRWCRIAPGDLFSTSYGMLVLAKGRRAGRTRRPRVATAPQCRRHAAARPRCAHAADPVVDGRSAAVRRDVRYCGGAGPHTAAPLPARLNPSPAEVALGYDLAGPPTVARILLDWRFDLLFGSAAIIFAAVYLAGVIRLRRRGAFGPSAAPWPGCSAAACCCSPHPRAWADTCRPCSACTWPRTCCCPCSSRSCWCSARPPPWRCALPTAGREIRLGRGVAAGRTAQPMVAVLHPSGRRHGDVRGGVLRAVLRRDLRCRGQPPRCTRADEPALPDERLPVLLGRHRNRSHAAVGAAAGQDRDGLRLDPAACLLRGGPDGNGHRAGERFYRSLLLPWHTDLLGDQHLGGSIAWAAGEVPLVVVMLALLIQWQRSDRRTSTRLDRAAEQDHDADMAAYNAMLDELARRDRTGR